MRSDHRNVLERLALLAPEPGDGPTQPERPGLPAIREFVEFLAGQFDTHMAAEDDVLFPIVAQALPATADSLAPLQLEHRELHTMLGALSALLDAPAGHARDEQIGIQLADLAELLRIHIRKEERLVFQVAERVLLPGELERLVSEQTGSHPQLPDPDSHNPKRNL
jgi:hemerythrin-like domain-containing protein